jgi:hypothetical protein
VTGHDVLLGMDWLYTHSPIEMDCKFGTLTVTGQLGKVQLHTN